MTSKTRSEDSSETIPKSDLAGDPNCPYCDGLGYVRQDVPVGHPDFGKLQVCVCRRGRIAQAVKDRLFRISHLEELTSLTFETFKPRGRPSWATPQAISVESAYNNARRYSENLSGWLFLQGGYGTGKTHLAAAIANYAVSMGVPTLFLTVPDLLDTLRFSYSGDEYNFEERFNDVRSVQLLVLDDFGTQNATSWAQEKLFQILNHRYINKLATVITTNMEIDEIEPRIRSRLADREFVMARSINAPDYRQALREVRSSQLSSLHLHAGQTFDTFVLRSEENLAAPALDSVKKARDAAQHFAEKPSGWLVFTGEYGAGKTHLAAAIANYWEKAGLGPVFITVPDLLDHLRATFNTNSEVSFDRRFDEIRTAPLLVLDDLGAQSMTPWVREKLHQLFDHRYNAALPTVITTPADELENVDPRLRSRLQDRRLCQEQTITAPAFHGKPSTPRKPHTAR